MIPTFETSSAFSLESLEQRLISNPHSPLFARLASLYIDTDRLEAARDLCEKGVVHYPDYATAHLVFGRCYLLLRRLTDARRELNQTLILQPRCRKARELLQEIDAMEEMLEEKAKERAEETAQQEEDEIGAEDFGAGELAGAESTSEIVTPTLAEIYATQGAYREAIRMYSLLLHRRPEERERFEQRIRELEEKRRTLESPN